MRIGCQTKATGVGTGGKRAEKRRGRANILCWKMLAKLKTEKVKNTEKENPYFGQIIVETHQNQKRNWVLTTEKKLAKTVEKVEQKNEKSKKKILEAELSEQQMT